MNVIYLLWLLLMHIHCFMIIISFLLFNFQLSTLSIKSSTRKIQFTNNTTHDKVFNKKPNIAKIKKRIQFTVCNKLNK